MNPVPLILVSLIALLTLLGCQTVPNDFDPPPLTEGCHENEFAFPGWAWAGGTDNIDDTDVHIERLTDYYMTQQPFVIIRFRNHIQGPFASETPSPAPDIVIAYGNHSRYCVDVLPRTECPLADKVYFDLIQQQFTANHRLDDPGTLGVIHGNSYVYAASSGEGDLITWESYKGGKPYGNLIDTAINKLKPCMTSVKQSLEEME